jgi:hypothetical protein
MAGCGARRRLSWRRCSPLVASLNVLAYYGDPVDMRSEDLVGT